MYSNSKVDKLVQRIKRQHINPTSVSYANSETDADISIGDVSIQCGNDGEDFYVIGYWDNKEQAMFIFAETRSMTAAANAFVDCFKLNRRRLAA